MANLYIDVGRFNCRKVRSYLTLAQASGMRIDFTEGKGFVRRVFTVRGEAHDLARIRQVVEGFSPRT